MVMIAYLISGSADTNDSFHLLINRRLRNLTTTLLPLLLCG